MVCFVNDVGRQDEENTVTIRDDDVNDLTTDYNDLLNLKVQKVAGGNIIKHPPIFSPCGEALFVICDENVRVFSSITGECIRSLEGIDGHTIIGQQFDLSNPKLLYTCTETGDITSWKWKSSILNQKQQLKLPTQYNPVVRTFALISMKNTVEPYALITWRQQRDSRTRIGIFDLTTGKQENIGFDMKLNSTAVQTAVGPKHHNYFAAIQNGKLYCVNYLNNIVKMWKNIQNIPIAQVACHPMDEIVVTGDVTGRILMYYKLFSKNDPITRLFHWHHTPITSIAFTFSGTNFYSGGLESVLCHWDSKLDKPIKFVPRMQGTPLHITIGADNQKIAVATDDNGIQILNAQNNPVAVIQYFTWIQYDRTEIPKFPIGLKVNPRTSSLVLNGRMGHLQFYSTYTKSLLFNLDIVQQNRLNIETSKILYNLYVSQAALNMDWLVTAEILDDHEHSIESRLKFWAFNEKTQKYALNTQIELPHGDDGVKCLEFSSQHTVENLLCASSGEYDVKVWALDDSQNYKNEQKVWYCIARTTYRNLPIHSLGFSADTSLLGVGFGNTLCLYTSETLKLKGALNAPAGLDGTISKISISMPKDKKEDNEKRKRFMEKRKKLQAAIKSMLSGADTKTIINNLGNLNPTKCKATKAKKIDQKSMVTGEKSAVFNTILSSNNLSLFQKISMFDALNLHGRVPAKWKSAFEEYCERIDKDHHNLNIPARISNLSAKHRFKYALKYEHHTKHGITVYPDTLRKLRRRINFSPTNEMQSQSNGHSDMETDADEALKTTRSTQKSMAQLKHLVFCTGEFAHLVIACTDSRLLIWNLLTLRLQSSFKIHVDKIAIDPYTSLVAVTTRYNDLFVFLPNTPIPLYQQKSLPNVAGLAWIPRQYPRTHSLTIDWQAATELYFLSENQELLRLVSDSDEESYNPNANYLSGNLQALPNTPFAAMIAEQRSNYAIATNQDNRSKDTYGLGAPGKNSIKELTSLQAYTMAPVNFLCTQFLKSLLVGDNKSETDTAKRNPTTENGDRSADNTDAEPMPSDDE